MFVISSSNLLRVYGNVKLYPRYLSKFIPRRTLLYVPGCDERKLRKARKLNVDLVAFDCEDGVALNQKDTARQRIREMLDCRSWPCSRPEWGVRVNAVSSELCYMDLEAILSGINCPPCILLPKVNTINEMHWFADTVSNLYSHTSPINLIVYSETAVSMMNLPKIVNAGIEIGKHSPLNLVALVMGSDDYVADIGATRTKSCSEIIYARQRLVMVAKAFELQAIDMVHIDIQDLDGLKKTSEEGAAWGFTGRQIIHPSQVTIVQAAYSPSVDKIKWATELIDAFRSHQELGKGSFVFQNQMIDMPTLKQAENIITLADATVNHK
ncbi:citramalyl-CoA lyase, mitochondrial [Orussus abietinus]|uniref:citramalyl-CoA lyase, mitochondrial n=1 Tax=Orussus abietinus TaxID=222816 RepID=UPI00062531A0|nr:citramalyl-CoA lyase, mitochondrial [Orussus abietinus]XP_012276608.1 citramalyl-CoA lyase, mitochondrial [Orussus abietinus]